jgi:hypothetical protein
LKTLSYRRSSALSKLAGDSTERKAAIEAIYSDPAYLRKGSVPGSDDALVNTAGAKKLFNIGYDDQYRSTNSNPLAERTRRPNSNQGF